MSLENRITSVVQAIGADIKSLNTKESFVFTQAVPAAIWVINHPLERRPSVTVADSADSIVEGAIQYNSNSQITITFSSGFSGKAYLN